MSFTKVRPIPSVEEILSGDPLTPECARIKAERDRLTRAILTHADHRILLIAGPCSAHDEEAMVDYAGRLAKVQETVKDRVVIVSRIYTTKPRTTGTGYKGMVHQPDPHGVANMAEGIRAIRRLHLRALRESHLTAAEEMLYPDNHAFLDDVLGYVAIGARSVENQQHRMTASGLEIPVGMKNPRSGALSVAFNAIRAAQVEHEFSYHGWDVTTSGNPLAHLVMRGGVDLNGKPLPNYYFEHLMNAAEQYDQYTHINQAIIVDVSHDNSGRRFKEQPRIACEVLASRRHSPVLRKLVRGIMIESFIEEGSQNPEENVYGKSITDPCLGWEETETLIYKIAEMC
ncbi:MAG: 3-deoxy-7-phosphoheptulonate synthase [Chitinispirillaceae bacterium]|jgi:3-deoxy-7-phosphoheptulonate synthase